jgi:hypothetical protein
LFSKAAEYSPAGICLASGSSTLLRSGRSVTVAHRLQRHIVTAHLARPKNQRNVPPSPSRLFLNLLLDGHVDGDRLPGRDLSGHGRQLRADSGERVRAEDESQRRDVGVDCRDDCVRRPGRVAWLMAPIRIRRRRRVGDIGGDDCRQATCPIGNARKRWRQSTALRQASWRWRGCLRGHRWCFLSRGHPRLSISRRTSARRRSS